MKRWLQLASHSKCPAATVTGVNTTWTDAPPPPFSRAVSPCPRTLRSARAFVRSPTSCKVSKLPKLAALRLRGGSAAYLTPTTPTPWRECSTTARKRSAPRRATPTPSVRRLSKSRRQCGQTESKLRCPLRRTRTRCSPNTLTASADRARGRRTRTPLGGKRRAALLAAPASTQRRPAASAFFWCLGP